MAILRWLNFSSPLFVCLEWCQVLVLENLSTTRDWFKRCLSLFLSLPTDPISDHSVTTIPTGRGEAKCLPLPCSSFFFCISINVFCILCIFIQNVNFFSSVDLWTCPYMKEMDGSIRDSKWSDRGHNGELVVQIICQEKCATRNKGLVFFKKKVITMYFVRQMFYKVYNTTSLD